ncbi:MAG: hypothetical protein NTZ97_01570 [Candidatus Moranbacteria bacterium]|nr:hypothetical protein [Candidatus Moranbacteria bacterium]
MSKTSIVYSDQQKKQKNFYQRGGSSVKMDPQIYCHICGRVVAKTHSDVLKNKDIMEKNDRFFQTACIQRKLAELDIREPVFSMEQISRLLREKAPIIMELTGDERLKKEQKLLELSELFFDNAAAFLYQQ